MASTAPSVSDPGTCSIRINFYPESFDRSISTSVTYYIFSRFSRPKSSVLIFLVFVPCSSFPVLGGLRSGMHGPPSAGSGVPFTSLSQILPFILIGIGVDDMVSAITALAASRRETSYQRGEKYYFGPSSFPSKSGRVGDLQLCPQRCPWFGVLKNSLPRSAYPSAASTCVAFTASAAFAFRVSTTSLPFPVLSQGLTPPLFLPL